MCIRDRICILKHQSNEALYLRLVNAHEMGHALGCGHDNDYKAGVNAFIMYSAASINATRFSRLSDFGGINYSSNLKIRNTAIDTVNIFLKDCSNYCERVEGINFTFYNTYDSIKISWSTPGRYRINYKALDAIDWKSTWDFVNRHD